MNAGYVYVIAFDSGLIKVGQTKNARTRFNTHQRTARSFGLTVADRWESPLHVGWLENERALKRIASELGGKPTTPEYFSGVSFGALTEKARDLPFEPPAAAEATQDAVPAEEKDGGTSERHDLGAENTRFFAIMPLVDMRARNVLNACRFLDLGLSPDFMRAKGQYGDADLMEVILGREADVRQSFEAATTH